MSEIPKSSGDEQLAVDAYIRERAEAASRWKSRTLWIGYSAAFVGYVLGVYGLSTVFDDPGFAFVLAFLPAIAVVYVMITVVLPMLPSPTLRCPFCAGRVPLVAPHTPFMPPEMTKMCPHCFSSLGA